MPGYRVISSDSHVMEPPDLWTGRVGAKFGDRAPRLVREDGFDSWYCDGIRIQGVSSGVQAGLRFEAPEKLTFEAKLEDVRLGGYIPEEHVKDQLSDGVEAGVLYPTVGLSLYRCIKDSELLTAIFRAYNDWIAEFCKPFPDRLRGIAMLNVSDVVEGVKELERCAGIGLAGAMITVYPHDSSPYNSPEYEPLWAAAQDLGTPLSLHFTTNRPAPGEAKSFIHAMTHWDGTNIDHWVRMSLAHMTFSGVFERYPKLQVGSVEHELSWVPHFLDRMDYAYTQRGQGDAYQFKEDMLPSDYFHRNVFLSFQEDGLGIKLRDDIGLDNLLWGSDYPHAESTFPRSRQILEEILAECTEEEKAKIAGGNAARVYHLG